MLQRIDVDGSVVMVIHAAGVSELNSRKDHMRLCEIVDKECGCGQ